MDIKIKAAIAAAPFVIAITVASTMAYPAYQDYTTKQQTVEEKKTEENELQTKLAGRTRLLNDKKVTEAALEKLHSSIPTKPELELLNIDLEKMCQESSIDLISFKEADKDQLRGFDDEPSSQKTSAQLLKDKVKGGAKSAGAAAANGGGGGGGGGATGGAKKNAVAGAADTGLSKVVLSVKCIGDYSALMDLVHKLETYQRVVAISELKTSVPKKVEADKGKKLELPEDTVPTETDKLGDYHRLNIAFLLTTYYLP